MEPRAVATGSNINVVQGVFLPGARRIRSLPLSVLTQSRLTTLNYTNPLKKDFDQEIERRHELLQNQPHPFFRSDARHRRHSALACPGRRADPETIARRQSS